MTHGQTIRPELRSLTYRDGERVIVGKAPPPRFADQVVARLCPTGHMPAAKFGNCPRCGTLIE